MNYKFKDFALNKEFILENVSEEEIFEHYLYPVDFSKKYTNPFRDDEHPDCNFYISKSDVLYFVDNAWNKKHYNCFNVVMEIYQDFSFYNALKHIYEDLILSTENSVDKKQSGSQQKKRAKKGNVNLKVKVKSFSKEELQYWNIGGVVSTEKELNSYGIYSVETVWEDAHVHDNLKHTFAYVENGKVTQIYFSRRKKGTRRFINTSGFIVGNLNNLKYDSEILIITKSKKDTYFLNKFGIESIYTTSEAITIDSELYQRLLTKYTYIFTLMDVDRTGFKSAIRHKRMGIDHLFVPIGKDFTEWLSEVGYLEITDVIEDFKKKLE